MAYDRKMGGWRGPVPHLEGGAATGKELGRTAGADGATAGHAAGLEARPWCWMPPTRRHGSAGSIRPDRPAGQAPQQRLGVLTLSDLAWARPMKDGKPGPAPRRIADVVQPGDVVMVEPGRRAGRATAKEPDIGSPIRRASRHRWRSSAWNCGRFPPCRARWSRSIPGPDGCSRWSAAGASRAASSTAPPRRSASRAPASSRSST